MEFDLPLCSLKTCRCCFDGNCIDRERYYKCEFPLLAEYESAKADGRLLVLPCRVGSRVYRVVPDPGVTWPDAPEYKVIWSTFSLDDIYIFKKKVFMTLEEAEQECERLNKP